MKINEEEIHAIKRFGFNNISQLLLMYCGLELDNKRLEEKIQKYEKHDNYILKIDTENTKKLNEMKEQLKLERTVVAPGVETDDYINIRKMRRSGNMNDIQDKQYLALELTKIKYQKLPEKVKRGDIMSDYWYFLNDLTGVLDKATQVEQLEKDVEALREFIRMQAEKQDNGKKTHRLIDVINQCKGDMEPYVYECLMAEINMKIQ